MFEGKVNKNVDNPDKIDITLPSILLSRKNTMLNVKLFLYDIAPKLTTADYNSLSRYCHSTDIVPFIDIRRGDL